MTKQEKENIAIVGAGPVGALLAVMLARKGYKIDLFESRPDSRAKALYQGKSINLALSDRGWLALKAIGLDEEIRRQAIPMTCRMIHALDGGLTRQPYGKDNQAIWSVSRAGINEQLITLAEQQAGVEVHFEHKLTGLDFNSGTCSFALSHQDAAREAAGASVDYTRELVFGADGTFSKVRRLAQELAGQRISYSMDYMPQTYIELTIPANSDGSFMMEKNALHIWPRKNFMLIALPNPDGSFTCTLFMDLQGEISFESLDEEHKVAVFFRQYFPDAVPLLTDPVATFMAKAPSPLCLVHIDPWVVNNKVALIGDAAHAMVPFYGQGMNCGFEDCRILSELVDKHEHDWPEILPAYQSARKENCDAIIELAKRNFVEMSDLAGDARFLLRKKIEAKFSEMYPELWIPLYSMVTFSPELPYAHALAIGEVQKEIMDEVMNSPDIEQNWQAESTYQLLYQLAQEKLTPNILAKALSNKEINTISDTREVKA
ncbi:FAD-dependent monooxygenase [Thalassomonas viridans]|uniref:Kynurenine 3-monooxygenase n=1 Tax=Thalassomonas viridans TaxID=137584 RepID=A0AAF0C7P7_9GAMM|nr:NAD(P)/FAD-dependent oxidoreductase [Thalassomonas viridans]WDE03390.1 FAD-dependent monooxygenase [Thalassomonas viridans]